jgi:hypothetical protein
MFENGISNEVMGLNVMETDTEMKQTESGELGQQSGVAEVDGKSWLPGLNSWSAVLAAVVVVGCAFFAWRRFSS